MENKEFYAQLDEWAEKTIEVYNSILTNQENVNWATQHCLSPEKVDS